MYRLQPPQMLSLPTCPKCGKFITESHYERHLRRCGIPHRQEQVPKAEVIRQEGETAYGHPDEEPRGANWTKVAAYFVIFLLIGSTVIFFVLYVLSLL